MEVLVVSSVSLCRIGVAEESYRYA